MKFNSDTEKISLQDTTRYDCNFNLECNEEPNEKCSIYTVTYLHVQVSIEISRLRWSLTSSSETLAIPTYRCLNCVDNVAAVTFT